MKSAITVRLDRVCIVSWATRNGWRVPDVSGFKTLSDRRVKPQGKTSTYERVRTLKSLTSDTKVFWQYQRRRGWLRPWRITMVADDKTGILPTEARPILVKCKFYRFVLVELAVDFEEGSKVDREFVKQHAVFGKSRRRRDRGGKGQLRYGARRSGKLVRCYRKKEVKAYRVEVELHSQLLRKHHIDNRRDLSGAASPGRSNNC